MENISWKIQISEEVVSMSYELHITKADHWVSSEQNPITNDDIKKVVDLLDTHMWIPFVFQGGRITLSGADKMVIGLMITIANRIGARVQGDEGEYYDNTNNSYPELPEHLRMDSVENIYESDIKTLDEQSIFIGSLLVKDKIQHAKYGTGEILGITGEGNDIEFLVRFMDEIGTKKLLAYFAPIRPFNQD
ncbi:hypothetical protein [Paenibacillus sp. JDR-2]|uniref:hypothetical protein n=1 Tax=Paenibacillus sp. (strain JDR-2) TaxID=324057 RepID=UPI00059FA87C|nr:hypothetical protein [Paenibacillus sp. JDR-2]